MHNLLIRPGSFADLPDIHTLVGDLARYEKAEHAFTASLADYQRDFQAGIFQTLVAELEGKVVGMALYFMTYSTWKGRMLWLEDFVVKEHLRGKGIGTRIFRAYLEEARKRKCRLVKWQVLDWNRPAIHFYEKAGATIEKDWWNGKIIFTTSP
jgi:GNAT superfamily N-acetyltransferase